MRHPKCIRTVLILDINFLSILGGSQGIGLMISEALVRNGAKVYVCSRKSAVCDKACEELNALGKGEAIPLPADLSKEDECKRVAKEIASREQALHILCNNAGCNW